MNVLFGRYFNWDNIYIWKPNPTDIWNELPVHASHPVEQTSHHPFLLTLRLILFYKIFDWGDKHPLPLARFGKWRRPLRWPSIDGQHSHDFRFSPNHGKSFQKWLIVVIPNSTQFPSNKEIKFEKCRQKSLKNVLFWKEIIII